MHTIFSRARASFTQLEQSFQKRGALARRAIALVACLGALATILALSQAVVTARSGAEAKSWMKPLVALLKPVVAPKRAARAMPPAAPLDGPTTFSNATAIAIVDTAAANPEAASPYPSNITVSGLNGTITDVTVTINGFTHVDPNDVDMLLIGPGGQRYIFWSDAGGTTDITSPGATITVSDSAAGFIPAPLVSGTFKPTNNFNCVEVAGGSDPANYWPSPVPNGPHQSAAHTPDVNPQCGSATFSSVFGGTIPNGIWSLYVIDDLGGGTGSILGGWSITITTVSAATTTTAVTSSLNPALTNQAVTFTATVSSSSTVNEGNVTFKDGGTSGTNLTCTQGAQPRPVSGGQATCTVAAGGLSQGDHTITAIYDGTANFATSNGSLNQRYDNPTVVTGNMYCNTGAITINSAGTPPPAIAATPFPSNIFVSGVSGLITKVTLTLNNFSHADPDDVDILLVDPGGRKFIVMSDVGGTGDVSNLTLTLDDAAASSLPDGGPLVSGTFRPTSVTSGAAETFPAPAPGAPYNEPAPAGTATFATVFNGFSPNGTWSLYVGDDSAGATAGSISGGWCLTITTAVATATATAVTSSPNPSLTGQSVTFTATVTSGGSPVTTGDVTFTEGATTLAANVPLNGSGQASFSTAALTEGIHVITATYNGTPTFAQSSGTVTQTVDNPTQVNGNQYCNTGPIAINSTGAPPITASPYPSRILVSGQGTICKVTLTLNNFSHADPDDVDILLVGPGGQKFVVMSDVGGLTDVNNLTLTFDDAAASLVPDGGPLSSTSYRPTNVASTTENFPAPAPAAPYNDPAPTGTATFASVFQGINPNGYWSLYVTDDSAGATAGSISGGWCLTFTALTCPSPITVNAAAGQCGTNVSYTAPTGCGTVTCAPASGSFFSVGTTTVSCTSDLGPACSFTVTVNDTQAPVISGCPTSPLSATTNASGCSVNVTYPTITALDNCDGARTVNCTPPSGSSFSKGTTAVSCTASDLSGNTAMCGFNVVVVDDDAPVISGCPTSPITATTTAPGCSTNVTFPTITAMDNCDGARTVTCTPPSGSSFNKGTTAVSCTASDLSGNTSAACSFSVVVTDDDAPAFSGCPTSSITATTSAPGCAANVTYPTITATDNCDGARTVTCTPPSGSSFNKGTTAVNCTASDLSGNTGSCSFNVVVTDDDAPVISGCPTSGLTATTASGTCAANVTYPSITAADNCDGARTVTCTPPSGSSFAKGTTTVNCGASDTSSNSSSCSFTVTVSDNQAPVLNCPTSPVTAVESPPGSGSATVTFSTSANDACDGARAVTCTPPSGSSFPVGTTTVNCSASDLSGNTGSCSFSVVVGLGCTIACPAPITTSAAAGQCGKNVTYTPPAPSGCGTVTCSPASNSFFPVGTTTVTCNTSAGPSCSFTVKVNDTQPPAITCPANIAVISSTPKVVTYTTPVGTDNCTGQTTTQTAGLASGSTFPVGTTTNTFKVTDAAGLMATCSFTVRVRTPVQAIDDLIAKVNALKPPLTNNQANGLINKLQEVKTKLNQGKIAQACNQLQAFINQVNGLTPNPLNAMQAQMLIDGANQIRAAIGCGGPPCALINDFDGDGKSDMAVWRGQQGEWLINNSGDGSQQTVNWGASYEPHRDLMVAADYDGDGKADVAVFRRGDGQWYIKRSSDGGTTIRGWGLGTDVPVPGDYDGDGKADIAVWRGAQGTWHILRSSDDSAQTENWGTAAYGDLPVPGDYDGDGKMDLAVFRRGDGRWYIKRSSDSGATIRGWGLGTDVPVPGDYDGDGKTDIAVWRGAQGTWYILRSSDDSFLTTNWGNRLAPYFDVAVPGDYDGDGKTDIAVWRAADGAWYIINSSDEAVRVLQHGRNGDAPVAGKSNP